MIQGLTGSLLSHDAIGGAVDSGVGSDIGAQRRLRAWHDVVAREMGPASSARAVFDRVAVPLCSALGFRVAAAVGPSQTGRLFLAILESDGRPVAALLATEWGRDPSAAWRDGVRHGIGSGLRWCYCVSGPALRIFDARHTYSRRFAEFNLGSAITDSASFAVFWSLLSAGAFTGSSPALDRAVVLSERYRAEVRDCLQHGVHDALTCLVRAFAAARRRRRGAGELEQLLDESLVVVYRVLFLLFAEARGLLPKWHPTFRDSYTIESLRGPIERHPRPPGLWQSLQSIARLAHRGCRAGSLRVPPFNGRLFSPAYAPLADSLALDDGAVRQAMVALTTSVQGGERRRIAYADLGVEQLGGVYERILDYSPVAVDGQPAALTLLRGGRRKSTGTFYTPRSLTEFLVRRALAPLVRDRGPDAVLSLRVLDPAMGSGAFLVAACRYLAHAYEAALVREGTLSSVDLGESDRAAFRRAVAQRCLFGVDVNPMAVQLGRLSLWLATLAADRPLTFLDHHLRAGNSLAGASLEDILRQPPSRSGSRKRAARLPLFDLDRADGAIGAAVESRISLATDPGDTIEQVRAKERLLASLHKEGSPLTTWRGLADLWCAEWFRTGDSGPARATFGALADRLLGRPTVLPHGVSEPLLQQAAAIARRERFFHWRLEFPEIFHDADGRPSAAPGFDAVIGNPPWEMLRGQRAGAHDAAALTAFARSSGVYAWQGDGHANLYQLFLERALTLVRAGGRLAVVLPAGFALDHGCAALRRALLDGTCVDTFVSVENREGLFPIHRGLKFLLITATRGPGTTALPCRFGVRLPDVLDSLPDTGDPGAVILPRSMIDAFTGDQSAIPEVRTSIDVAVLSRTASTFPALGSADGWDIRFGRELNATDDRQHFVEGRHGAAFLPVVEGKHIRPFVADIAASSLSIPARTAARLLGPRGGFTHARLAYRDVAAATNRLTLIAAIIPANVVTTHTLFCLKRDIAEEIQLFLCGVFNSFAANYLVRTRVGMHVTVAIIDRLPVPKPSLEARHFGEIVDLVARLRTAPFDGAAAARLQASVARLYELSSAEFQHVLESFPLVPTSERTAAMTAFAEVDRDMSRDV